MTITGVSNTPTLASTAQGSPSIGAPTSAPAVGATQLSTLLNALRDVLAGLTQILSQLSAGTQAANGAANLGGPTSLAPAVGGANGGATVQTGATSPVMQMDHAGEAHTAGDAHTAGGGGHSAHNVIPPAENDPRFVAGTTGPPKKEGDAATVKIPDGKGFGGQKGRKQNGNDKKQNNYSVTDANFNNQLGLLAQNPDGGGKLNYVQHIQMYSAAGYLENFAPEVYAKLIANQNAGKGTVLGGAAHIMGLVKTADASEAGLSQADLAGVPAQVPGSPIDARQYVMSAKDITGQDWARMHHPESAWQMYKGLIAGGVDWKNAMVLSGDDGVSGAGRVNGVNNQDGNTGFNAGEKEIWSLGAQLQEQTGIAVIQKMMEGHNHDTGQDASALTKPKINKLIGFDKADRTASAARANAIEQVLLNGKVGNAEKAAKNGTKADNKYILNTANQAPAQARAGAQGVLGGPSALADIGALLQQLLAALTQAMSGLNGLN